MDNKNISLFYKAADYVEGIIPTQRRNSMAIKSHVNSQKHERGK